MKEAYLDSSFSIDVVADINTPVIGWGLDILMTHPGVASISADPLIGPEWSSAFTPDGDKLGGLAFPTGVTGQDVLLARLFFHADADGETDLLLDITSGDGTEGFALDPSGFGTYHFDSGHVSVPEPGLIAPLLLGIALAVRRS